MISIVALSLFAQVMCSPDGGPMPAFYVKTIAACTAVGTVGHVGGGSSSAAARPGGSYPMVQYNCGDGGFCGADNVWVDGGNLGFNGMVAAHPPAPGAADQALVYEWLATTGMPVQPLSIDNAMGVPTTQGMFNLFSQIGTAANWRVSGCMAAGFGSSALTEIGDVASASCGGTSGSCTSTGPVWASTSLYTRSPVHLSTKAAAGGTNTWCGTTYVGTASTYFWRGNSAGAGGFFLWVRTFIVIAPADGMSENKMFVGIINSSLPAGASEPNVLSDTAYFGANTGQRTIRFMTNDNSGNATQVTDLGANFPIQTGAWYDFFIWAKPNDSSIYGAAVRLDSAQNSGLLTASSDLPRNTVTFSWQALLGSAGIDAGPTAIAASGGLTAWNF